MTLRRAVRLLLLILGLSGLAGTATAATPDAVPALAAPTVPVDTALATVPVRFATLAAAVAAQVAGAEDEPVRCLASAIYFESKGEPLAGQLAVGHVILNRAASGRYPADVCGVVKQRGQFSFVRGGVIPAIDAGRAAWRTAVSVAKVALASAWTSPVPTALFFNGVGAGHGGSLRVATIGHHAFYR